MDELERFKSEINLTTFAASRGYRVDRRESSRSCVVMRDPATGDKIVVSRSPRDGHWIYFSVRDARDQGTIVDFVQRRAGGTLGDVRRALAPWLGPAPPSVAPELYRQAVEPRTVDRALAARLFEEARAVVNSAYLNARGIKPAILCSERFAGTFREDARGNVLFPHRDTNGFAGFESKNLGWTSFSPGGVRALWWSNCFDGDTGLVLVESAIDALSFHQVQGAPPVRYASTAGTLSQHQRLVLRQTVRELPRGISVALAFDRDAAGDSLADEVRALGGAEFSRCCPPTEKDWNDHLRTMKPERDGTIPLSRGASRER
jgi:hypothetical protein